MTYACRSLFRAMALSPMIVAAGAAAACAQDVRQYDIPAGDLGRGLVRYAEQSGRQILYTSDQVVGRRTAGVRGRQSADVALSTLLAGTGLTPIQSRPGVYTLGSGRVDASEATVEEVVVTGTLLRGPSQTFSPVTVIRRGDLDRTGRGTVAEALVALPQNYAGSATPATLLAGTDPAQSNSGFATGVNLRGLGADATLVLVNGRRLSGTGGNGDFADASAVPTSAVERVDVLLDGASALYGSDAVGGVVNIILRRDFEGHESRLRLGAAEGGAEDFIAAHTVGRRWNGGNALLSYEYQNQGNLNSADRAYTATGDLRPFGGTDRRTFYGAAGTIVASGPGGAFVPLFAIRPNAGGTATTPADFVAGTNLGNNRQGLDLIPEQERHSVYGLLRQRLTDGVEVSADLRFSQRDFGIDSTAPITVARVSTANPFFVSPNGSASHQIAYSFDRDLGSSRREGNSKSLGFSAGADIELWAGWRADIYGAYALERSENRQTGLLNSQFVQEALGNAADNPATAFSAPRDGFLNLFGSGQANAPAVLDFISAGYTRFVDKTEVASLNALAQGVVFRIPGGDVRLAVGAQARSEAKFARGENFLSSLAPTFSKTPGRDRKVLAAFLEARVPLVGEANARPGIQRLELSFAVRTEDYSDIGTTTNPKIGLAWSPHVDLRVRSSWGTSFRAPSLTELFERFYITAAPLPDGPRSTATLLLGGGNLDLEPETAESFTAGLDYTPARLPGLTLSATWFETRFDNQIGRPALDNVFQALIDPAYLPFLTRVSPTNPTDLARVRALISSPDYLLPGVLPAEGFGAIVDGRWVNTASVQVRGIDGSANYAFERGPDRFRLEASASYMLEYERQLTPTSNVRDVVDTFGFPVDLRASAGLTWTRSAYSARVGLTYVSGYEDSVGSSIGSWTTSDLQLTWDPEAIGRLDGLTVSAGIRNVFDEDPPFYDAPSGLGYDAGQADPIGRFGYIQLTQRW